MSRTINEWAAAQKVRLINVSISVDTANYLFVAAIYDDSPDDAAEAVFREI
jgi:hypothetical protein